MRKLDLEIAAGGVVSLVDANGSGKSTLISHPLGLVRSTSRSTAIACSAISDRRWYASRIEKPESTPSLAARVKLCRLMRVRGTSNELIDEVRDALVRSRVASQTAPEK